MAPTKPLANLLLGLILGALLLAALLWMVASQTTAHASPAANGGLTRGPYLQSVTTDSVIVVWDTDVATEGRVDYGLTPGYGSSVTDPALTTHHAVTLGGLQPYTVYHYQVFSDGTPLTPTGTFRTAASPAQQTFSFAAFGDTRTNHADHQSVVDRIVALAPDLVFHTGDLVQTGSDPTQWDTFFAIERDMMRQFTLFPAIGNHEQNHANYYDAFHLPGNERWYSFDYGPVHFVALQVDGYRDYSPGSPQYTWLQNDLAATDREWKIVFFHNPPYSSGPHGDDAYVPSLRAALPPLFVQYGVDLVFNGHDHDYERSVVTDVTYIVAGGGGAPLYDAVNPNPYSIYFSSTLHAVSVTVSGNSLSAVSVRPDGVTFDPFLLTHVVAWNGSQGSDWHDPDNWTPTGVPDAFDDVVILSGPTSQPVIGSGWSAVCDDLAIQLGASLTLQDETAGLTVEGALTNNGTFRQAQTVGAGAAVDFLRIGDGAGGYSYYGARLADTSGGGLGVTTVEVLGNQYCPAAPDLGSSPILRCFSITPSSQNTATLRLYYLVSELNGNITDTLYIYRIVGSGWSVVDNPSGYSYETDGSDGYYSVQVTGVGEYSFFTAGNHGPVLIELASFSATAGEDGVLVAWETASEIDNAGFNVWRANSANGAYVKLNEALIPAQGGPTQGAAYSFLDEATPSGVGAAGGYYKLEDVDTSGVSTLHGPVRAEGGDPTSVGLRTFEASALEPSEAWLVVVLVLMAIIGVAATATATAAAAVALRRRARRR